MEKSCRNCANGTWTKGMDAVPKECFRCRYVSGEPSKWKENPMTNADRIRAMTDEELAQWIDTMYCKCLWCNTSFTECIDTKCTDCIEKWLKQPSEE